MTDDEKFREAARQAAREAGAHGSFIDAIIDAALAAAAPLIRAQCAEASCKGCADGIPRTSDGRWHVRDDIMRQCMAVSVLALNENEQL